LADNAAGFGWSDAAKRMADNVNFHVEVEGASAYYRWVAIRLSDGGSDHVLYDSRADAVRSQSDSRLCTYVMIPPTGMTPREAEPVLKFTRFAYDNGYRITDPADGMPVMPNQKADLSKLMRSN